MERYRLKISNKEDQLTAASILVKNGYSVRLIYVKTEGKSAREGYLEVWKE